MITASQEQIVLVRYGAIAEVARFRWRLDAEPVRGQSVVVRCHRGEMLGRVLERVSSAHDPTTENAVDFEVLRPASADDERLSRNLRTQCAGEFAEWLERIATWELDLQLIDVERTLDGGKQILYVLCDRGPESTKLALQAAAAGLGIIEVQPVGKDGLITLPSGGGGCGSGSGSCGCGD